MNSAEASHLRHVPPVGAFHPMGPNATAEFAHQQHGHQQHQLIGLSSGEESDEDLMRCHYEGTDYLEVKIVLIGMLASGIALISFLLNAFLVLVFAQNPKLRRSPLFYFGVLALLDLALALLYLALMAVPVYMDQFRWLWLYHLFLKYLRPMLTLSNFAMFASVLMILLATTERLLLTFSGKKIRKARRLLERHRPQVTLLVMAIAGAYKLCTYFEIEVAENGNCTGFEQYEVVSAVHEKTSNPVFIIFGWDNYKFWWMFVIRNLVDHIFPFFVLVILNFHIIRALRRERLRATQHLADVLCSAAPPLVHSTQNSEKSRRGSIRSIRESIRNKVRLRNKLQKVSAGTAEEQAQKKNLRAATRALVSVVSMYLMSKVLQVAVTFFETFASDELIMEANFGDFRPVYSYVNDAISILTLLSSALRFPVYCACNKPMLIASKATLRRLMHHPIGQNQSVTYHSQRRWRRSNGGYARNGPPLLKKEDSTLLANGNGQCPVEWPASPYTQESTDSPPPGKRRVLRLLQNGRLEAEEISPQKMCQNGAATARIASPEGEDSTTAEEELELFC